MQNESLNIALLYFSRTVSVEAEKKNWFKGDRDKNLTLSTSLTRCAHQTLKRSKLPFYHYHEGNQKGGTFGQRLSNAFHEVFQLGYEGVIAIGNDSPELVSLDLNSVARQLVQGKCVLGPSFRGGTYLIGLTKRSFDRNSFQTLPWKKANLFESFRDLLRSNDREPELLAPLRDINSFHDVLALLKNNRIPVDLERIIRLILTNLVDYVSDLSSAFKTFIISTRSLRAPPAFR